MPDPNSKQFHNYLNNIQMTWHAMETFEVIDRLNVPAQSGLSDEAVISRQETHGPNEIVEKKPDSFFKMVIRQLNSFVVVLLVVASVVSALLEDWPEAIAILIIVILNAILGVVQESRAEQALAALKKLASPEAQVLRNGKRIYVPARELVPGDIIFLEAGNFVPADIRLLEAINLQVDEAALTGESVPVIKSAEETLNPDIPIGDRKNTAFMGTTVTYGRGSGIVISTGMYTQLGLIADMLQLVEDETTPLQKKLDDLGKVMGWAALGICGLVFLTGLLRTSITTEAISEMFMISVSLAIAAVPEGLPAVVTITLAIGMREMVKRNALIRRLASVETLGSATVICSDKTGTLTQNEMTVTQMWVGGKSFQITGSGHSSQGQFLLDRTQIDLKEFPAVEKAIWVGVLNNDAVLEKLPEADKYRIIGDPTEGSLLIAAAKAGAFPECVNGIHPRENEIPFDSSRKRMITIHTLDETLGYDVSPFFAEKNNYKNIQAIAVKGAPDVILDLCSTYEELNSDNPVNKLDAPFRKMILDANDSMSQQALRVIALAYRLVPEVPTMLTPEVLEKDLNFVGLIGMIDPAREEVKPAIIKAKNAGIRTIMITGDYPNTARAIAEDIGLLKSGNKVISGKEINVLSDETLSDEVNSIDVFARVSPEHKTRIVQALKSNHEIVAMTGDGVNDAPAIKRADIGVAMGITGSDVAKETADMVLTDDNYASIVSAIEQGRIIYSNIRKFVFFLLSCNLAEITIIFLSTLLTGQSPLTAIQILWLNLVTDGAPALALATEEGDPNIMDQPPRPSDESIINRSMRSRIIIQTMAISASTLAAFFIGKMAVPENHNIATTMAFATLSLSELLRVYTTRSEINSVFRIGVFSNRWINLAVLSSLIMILAVIYIPIFNPVFTTQPLSTSHWFHITPLLIAPSLVAEITKILTKD